ncbi:hypothetical protein HYV31_02845 [candidate division WWE3 bacterium]|nr:hypothetical protein [candidate division WWE3 bacterium]
MKTNSNKPILTFFLGLVFSLPLVFTLSKTTAYAQVSYADDETVTSPCGGGIGVDTTMFSFELGKCSHFQWKLNGSPLQTIVRTVGDTFIAQATEVATFLVWGHSLNQHQACMAYLVEEISGTSVQDQLPPDIKSLYPPAGGGICAPMLVKLDGGEANKLPSRAFIGGSLAGLTYIANETAFSDKGVLPSVNLANYGRYVASNTLILKDTALAQVNFPGGLVPTSVSTAIMDVWKLIRNISYGLLAIFMIYVGSMIMMRRQISSQVVVTAQYAVPRIVISIILITFSMTIGLIGIGLITPIQMALIQPIKALGGAGTIGPLTIAVLTSGSILSAGVGLMFIILTIFMAFLNMGLWLVASVKYIFIYIKLIMASVSAPLTFAWGSIPGNEEKISDWFKYFLANMLALPAMALTLEVGNYILYKIVVENVIEIFTMQVNAQSNIFVFFDALGSFLFGIIMGFAIFFQALKMPKIIEEAFLGEQKTKRR